MIFDQPKASGTKDSRKAKSPKAGDRSTPFGNRGWRVSPWGFVSVCYDNNEELPQNSVGKYIGCYGTYFKVLVARKQGSEHPGPEF